MWVELFFRLLLAHLVADFVLQTTASCKSKAEKHWRSGHQYLRALIVFALAWLVSWDVRFWWGALAIGIAHLCTDIQPWSDDMRPEDMQYDLYFAEADESKG